MAAAGESASGGPPDSSSRRTNATTSRKSNQIRVRHWNPVVQSVHWNVKGTALGLMVVGIVILTVFGAAADKMREVRPVIFALFVVLLAWIGYLASRRGPWRR